MDFQVVGEGVERNIYVAYLNDRFLIIKRDFSLCSSGLCPC